VALDASEAPAAPSGAVALDVQDWQFELLEQSLGDQAREVALALRRRADVFLRVNTGKTDLAKAQAWLASCGTKAVPDPICATALRVCAGARKISTSAPYLEGHVELQDGASQAVVESLPLRPGMRVLDYCAGGG